MDSFHISRIKIILIPLFFDSKRRSRHFWPKRDSFHISRIKTLLIPLCFYAKRRSQHFWPKRDSFHIPRNKTLHLFSDWRCSNGKMTTKEAYWLINLLSNPYKMLQWINLWILSNTSLIKVILTLFYTSTREMPLDLRKVPLSGGVLPCSRL